jgi:TonB family protein
VIAPELLDANHFTIPMTVSDGPVPADAEVGLTLTVDESGRPQDVKVVKSLNPVWDTRVLDAVSRAHFKPGSIDTQPIPVEMNLTVNIAQ